MAWSPLETLSKFVDSVGEQISITFKNISEFLDLIHTFFITLGFWTSVIGYFIILLILLFAPILVVKYWSSITESYKKIINKLINKNLE